jgi:hypothetical protein
MAVCEAASIGLPVVLFDRVGPAVALLPPAATVTVADPTDAQQWADALRRCHREAPALAAAAELEAARRRCECKARGQEQQQSGSPSCELPLAGAIRELEVAATAPDRR